ncbi:MAG: hypothetical protein LUI05_06265 [Oscillospiraceae bacterium]|nr:hypothetical protein [Oscillospiraceae bacterium]
MGVPKHILSGYFSIFIILKKWGMPLLIGYISRAPSMKTGITLTPVFSAINAAPFLNSESLPFLVRVPSGCISKNCLSFFRAVIARFNDGVKSPRLSMGIPPDILNIRREMSLSRCSAAISAHVLFKATPHNAAKNYHK